jgi:hypothetical protein
MSASPCSSKNGMVTCCIWHPVRCSSHGNLSASTFWVWIQRDHNQSRWLLPSLMTGNGPQLLLLWNHNQLHAHSKVPSQQVSVRLENTLCLTQCVYSGFSHNKLLLNSIAHFNRLRRQLLAVSKPGQAVFQELCLHWAIPEQSSLVVCLDKDMGSSESVTNDVLP